MRNNLVRHNKRPNKPYDEVLGAAQLTKQIKACKSV